jgi:uncharacterized protein involved in cysteine biosynthesis
MVSALSLALAQLPERGMRGPILLSLLWSVVVLVGLALATGIAIGVFVHPEEGHAWVLGLFGGMAVAVVVGLLFPSVILLVMGFYTDAVIDAVERRHYPGLPAPRRQNWPIIAWLGLKLAATALLLNLLALPLYLFLPGANLAIYLALNGYLIGRDYFYSVALRRLGTGEARLLWRDHRVTFWVAGAITAGLFLVPVVDLLAPIIGIAVLVHLVERLRQPFATTLGLGPA